MALERRTQSIGGRKQNSSGCQPPGFCVLTGSASVPTLALCFRKHVLASETSPTLTSPAGSCVLFRRCLGDKDQGSRDQAFPNESEGATSSTSALSGLPLLVEVRVSLLIWSLHKYHVCLPLTCLLFCSPRAWSSLSSFPSGPRAKPPLVSLCQPVNVPLCGCPDAKSFLGRCYFNI